MLYSAVHVNHAMRKIQREKIIALRARGKSYNEIADILGIAKSTVSYWLRGVLLTAEAQRRLHAKIEMARERGLLAFNKRRSRAIKIENKTIRKDAAQEISHLSSHDLFLIGIALYWGEGAQSENHSNPRLRFANSNPFMVLLFMKFLREIMGIAEAKIKPAIQIHPNIRQQTAINFWSKVIQLPPTSFKTFMQVSRASKSKRPRRSLPYGTIFITINDRRLFYRMKGWIDGLAALSSSPVQDARFST